ncbi:hypothetical protein NKG05_24740 [Oerskovia sp. M15]
MPRWPATWRAPCWGEPSSRSVAPTPCPRRPRARCASRARAEPVLAQRMRVHVVLGEHGQVRRGLPEAASRAAIPPASSVPAQPVRVSVAETTVPRPASITPAEPMPTPTRTPGEPGTWARRRRRAGRARPGARPRRGSRPPLPGRVGTPARARTVPSSRTSPAAILVPPRSIPTAARWLIGELVTAARPPRGSP